MGTITHYVIECVLRMASMNAQHRNLFGQDKSGRCRHSLHALEHAVLVTPAMKTHRHNTHIAQDFKSQHSTQLAPTINAALHLQQAESPMCTSISMHIIACLRYTARIPLVILLCCSHASLLSG
jgi:hypothetical protein